MCEAYVADSNLSPELGTDKLQERAYIDSIGCINNVRTFSAECSRVCQKALYTTQGLFDDCMRCLHTNCRTDTGSCCPHFQSALDCLERLNPPSNMETYNDSLQKDAPLELGAYIWLAIIVGLMVLTFLLSSSESRHAISTHLKSATS